MTQPTSKVPLDAELVNPIMNATIQVLHTMANTETKLKGVRAQPDYFAMGDISAVIGITGAKGEGMVSLSFTLNNASLIVSRLLGISPEQISADDRSDGIGELANMISGNAKSTLAEQTQSPYKLSLPSIILGSGHQICSRPKGSPYLIMEFEAEGQPFFLQISFKHF
jgi:chemotaxis protein CheX